MDAISVASRIKQSPDNTTAISTYDVSEFVLIQALADGQTTNNEHWVIPLKCLADEGVLPSLQPPTVLSIGFGISTHQ